MRKKNPKTNKTNFESYRTQAEVLGHSYIQFIQDYIYCPRHEVPMGFSTVCTERVIQFSRPDGRSYWTLRRRDWIFPEYLLGSLHFAARQRSRVQWSLLIRTVPALRCKIEILRAKGTFGAHFVARSESRVQIIWIERTTPLEGLWSASDEESYWQTSQTLLLEL